MALEIFKLMGTIAINKDKALQDIKAVQDQAKRASTEMGGSFTKFSGYVEKHSAQIKKAGRMMTIFGGIATAVFAVAVKGAADFETQLANVSTMLDESAMRILPEYRRGLQDLSVEFGESTQTLSKGLYDILSASIPPAEALGVLEISAKAAAAGITDTGVAADAITTILNSYGMSADQAGIVSDKLFAIVKRGKTTFAELAPSIGKVAATASISGLSFDDLGASIATITRAGIRSEEAMTAINGILRAFLSPTTEAIAAAKGFGLEMNTNTLRTEGLTGVMGKLTDATAEQLSAIFPNIRGLKGMAAALGDAEGYARDYELMLNSLGLTQEAFTKQSDTLSFKLDQLKQTFNVVKVEMGTALIPMIQEITENLIITVTKMKDWIKANPEMAKGIAEWGLKLAAVMLVLGPFLMMLPGIIAAWPAIAAGATVASGAFTALAVSLGLAPAALALAIIGFGKLYIGIRKAWDEVKNAPSWKDIAEMAKKSAKAQATALEKLQKAYNLTNEELQYWIDNQKMVPRILNESRRVMQLTEADTRAMATANRDYVETIKQQRESLEDLDSAIAVSIITGGELSEQQEEYMERRKRMSDLDRTATQKKIDDLDLECIALINNMETNLMTMEEIDEYRQLMLDHIIAESSEREEHLRNLQEVEDRLFELSHTRLEQQLQDLEDERLARIETAEQARLSSEELADAQAKIQEVYQKDKDLIIGTAVEKSQAIIDGIDKEIVAHKKAGESIDELMAKRVEEVKNLTELYTKQTKDVLDAAIQAKKEEIDTINQAIRTNDAMGKSIDGLITKRNAEIENLRLLKEGYSGAAKAAEALATAEAKKPVGPIGAAAPGQFKVLDPEGNYIGVTSDPNALTAAEIVEGWQLVPLPVMGKGGLIKTFMEMAKHLIRGGATDTVPIMATPGEYVIKKQMVDFIRRTGMVTGGLIEAIQKGLPTPSPQFAGGGMVGRWGISPTLTTEPSGITKTGKWTYSPNVSVLVQGDGDPVLIKEAVKEALEESADAFDLSGFEVEV